MKVTLLDTETGETVDVDDGITTFMWADGNYSCDCNRKRYFGLDDDYDSPCVAKRFLVVAREIEDIEGDAYPYNSLRQINHYYPNELLDKYLPKEEPK